jgi:hypothetical protein
MSPVRRLAHPIVLFIVVVCSVIGIGVGVLAATGIGGLSLALTCAPPSAHRLGPPGARFTVNFRGAVVLSPPYRYAVDVAPSYEFCTYRAKPSKESLLTLAAVSVNGYPRFPHTDTGQRTIRCFPKGGGCLGLMVLANRQYQWFVTGGGANTRVVGSFLRSFHPVR